ncbi:MAG: DapH/DapD/GlmU-related protein [Planctomycetota bacterium]
MSRTAHHLRTVLLSSSALFAMVANAADPLAPGGEMPLQFGTCPADCAPQNPDGTIGNGQVNIDDLLAVINSFGDPGGPCDSAPDNGDGTFGNGQINIDDLLATINAFGPCPVLTPIGSELYESFAQVNLDLPAEFFGPGSLPFNGVVNFQGVPIGTSGAFVLGTTDTVITRLDYMELPDLGSTDIVPVEMVELNLQSTAPINVGTSNWLVSMGLSADPSEGQMQVTKDFPDGGAYEGQILVKPIFTFINTANPLDQVQLDALYDVNAEGFIDFSQPSPPLVPYSFSEFVPDSAFSELFLAGPGFEMQLTPAQFFPPPPPAFVHPSANVHPTAQLGPNSFIGANATIGANVIIGPNAQIGDQTVVEDGSVVGADTQLVFNVQVGPRTWIGSQSLLEDSVFIGANTTIERFATLLSGVTVGNDARLGSNSVMQPGSSLGDLTVTQRDVQIGLGAVVGPDLSLTRNAVVPGGSTLNESLMRCMLDNGFEFITTPMDCSIQNGAVWEAISTPYAVHSNVTIGDEAPQADPNTLPLDLVLLSLDIDNAGVSKKNPGQAFVKDTHDCDDFADELEQALEALGYDATFTVYWCYDLNPAWTWDNRKTTPRLINTFAHAITDVHSLFTNEIVWVEPQLSTGQGAFTHPWVQLDFDGDGKVEYDTDHKGGLTDGNYRIEVYPNRKAAEKAGVKMD